MKKMLTILAFSFIILPVYATKYSCQYQENNTYYSGHYTINETANEHCKTWCNSDFWKQRGECDKCLNQDYPRMLKAYNSGSCKKIMPPIIYNDVEGCECKVLKLEDGQRYATSCYGTPNNKTCNTNKAMKKLDWMLTE